MIFPNKFAQILLLTFFLGAATSAAGSPFRVSERFVLRSVRTIHAAEMTYGATYGNGNYGALSALGQAHLIDVALATGNKYGYMFVLTTVPWTPTSPAAFTLTATPRVYRKTGRLSFFIDTTGEIRGGDKGGQPANASDPVIDDCTQGSIIENERCTIGSLRILHGAEMTYAATYGNGNYAALAELGRVQLIDTSLATGQYRGYSISVVRTPQTQTESATFRISAVPQTYGITGIRSFYVDTTGVIRGADKDGQPADQNDPPINN